jgi:glycosyltransferase involved in cell wall biosynthesis
MATGLPLVATATDGSAEAVQDGINGLLVPPSDPARLAQALLRLLNEPTLARQMGEAGRASVEEFSDYKMVAQIDALYCQLLNAKKIAWQE